MNAKQEAAFALFAKAVARKGPDGWVFEGPAKEGCITGSMADFLRKEGLIEKAASRVWKATLTRNSGSASFRPSYVATTAGLEAIELMALAKEGVKT